MNIVITGGSSGLGEELAKILVREGHEVWVLARSKCKFGKFLKCDVTLLDEVKNCYKEIYDKSGQIDVLISNAGVGISGALELTPMEENAKVMDVNFWGVLNCYRQVLQYMNNHSKILNISSACALFALPYRSMYCASKAAVNMISIGATMELKESGIQVCAICPGEIQTPFTENRIKSFQSNSRYGDKIEKSAKHIDERQDTRMSVQNVAQIIVKQVYKKKVKPMIIIGGKYKFLHFLQRFVSTKTFVWATNKMFNKK